MPPREPEYRRLEDTAVPDTTPSADDPAEQAICRLIWQYAFLPERASEEKRELKGKLALSLEYYLCGIFPLIEFTRARGVWCDGIVDFTIRRLHRLAFIAVGSAYCPHALTPFELEFHFERRRNLHTSHILFRFGALDDSGDLQVFRGDSGRDQLHNNWPQCDREWAVVVELTPPIGEATNNKAWIEWRQVSIIDADAGGETDPDDKLLVAR